MDQINDISLLVVNSNFWLILGIILLSQSIFVVKETERAVKLRFGEIVEADVSPGLHFKLPIVNTVRKFDAE